MKTPAVSESVANQGDTVRLDMANTSIGHGAINVQLSLTRALLCVLYLRNQSLSLQL